MVPFVPYASPPKIAQESPGGSFAPPLLPLPSPPPNKGLEFMNLIIDEIRNTDSNLFDYIGSVTEILM